MSITGHGNPACSYLGLEDDADTSLAFASVWNTCHRGRRIVSPSLQHQAEYCLRENHRNCVAFSSGQQVTLPQHLRASYNRTKKPPRSPYQSFGFVLIGLVALIGAGWGVLNAQQSPPAITETSSRAITALMTPAVTQTRTFTPVPTPIATTLSPVLTGEIPSSHRLEQPIGSDHKFVIHKILYGENLNQCAAKYNTSIEAIVAVNYDLKTPVWVDTLVIIPVGFTDVAGLPTLEPYEVTRSGTSLKVLALGFGVSLEDLKYYNAIGTDESLEVGDWLLIPHLRLAP